MRRPRTSTTILNNKFFLAFAGVAVALAAAVGILYLFVRFGAETYATAIEQAGATGSRASSELYNLHREIAKQVGLRGILARSIMA